jgi:hypothetical protein
MRRPEAYDHIGLLFDGPVAKATLPFIKSSDYCYTALHRSPR